MQNNPDEAEEDDRADGRAEEFEKRALVDPIEGVGRGEKAKQRMIDRLAKQRPINDEFAVR